MDYFYLRLPEALEKAEQAVELARGQDDPQAAWYPHMDAARALWLKGGSGAAQQHLSAALELAERLHNRSRLARNLATSTRLCLRLGNWQQAWDFSDHGLAVLVAVVSLQRASPGKGHPEATRLYLDGLGRTLDEVSRLHEPGLVGVGYCLCSVPEIEL